MILLITLGILVMVAGVNYVQNVVKPVQPRFIGGHSYSEAGGHSHEHAHASQVQLPPEFNKPIITMGNPHAPVVVKAFLRDMGGCHSPTYEALKKLAKRYPKRIFVKIINLDHEKGAKIGAKAGIGCTAIMVNGKSKFELPSKEGKRRTVVLEGPIGPSYTLDDLEEIVRREVEKAKGGGEKK